MNPQEKLIARLKRIVIETQEPMMYRVDHPQGKTWMADFLIKTAEQAIAEIQRQDRHLERLGDTEAMVQPDGEFKTWPERDLRARIAYACANRYEDEK